MLGNTLRLLATLAALAWSSLVMAQQGYDVVIANGRVMDPETGLDAVRYVGIRGGTIAAVSDEKLDGERVVDATDLVVAPGFIDLHAHGQSAKANEFQAMDGVTTALELEGGVLDMDEFLAERQGEALIHYGASVAHGSNRILAMPDLLPDLMAALDAVRQAGDDNAREAALKRLDTLAMPTAYREVSEENYPALRAALGAQLDKGALGFGVPHQYYPGATYDEIYRVFEFAAERDVPIFTHVRDTGVAPIQEVIANAATTGASLHIVHLNSSSLGDYRTNIDLIRGAQRRGLDVTTEAYPYTAASTYLESAMFDPGWQEKLGISYGDIQWQDTGERLTEESFTAYREEGGAVIIHLMKPEWIRALVSDPIVMIASDGMPYAPGAHPRSAGTFSRFLGRYVREDDVMSLMDALRKITLMPAQRMEALAPQMKRKGRLQAGADADITMFDPDSIIDTATFEDDLSYSKGVEYLLVNGEFVVEEGRLVDGARPGQPILGRYHTQGAD